MESLHLPFEVPADAPCVVEARLPDTRRLWVSDEPRDQAEAAASCRGCPVRVECYWYAIERREQAGVWGGSVFPDEWKSGMRKLAARIASLPDPPPARGARRALPSVRPTGTDG